MKNKTVIKLNENQFIEIVNKTAKKLVNELISNNDIKLLESRLNKKLGLTESRDEFKSKDGQDFLAIVKRDNPNLYQKYINLIVNKSLEFAKNQWQTQDSPTTLRKKKEDELKAKKQRQIQLQQKKENEKYSKKENAELYIKQFVNYLPENLPKIVNDPKTNVTDDTKYFFTLGEYLGSFCDEYELDFDKMNNLISNVYDEYFDDLIDEKYGQHAIEF